MFLPYLKSLSQHAIRLNFPVDQFGRLSNSAISHSVYPTMGVQYSHVCQLPGLRSGRSSHPPPHTGAVRFLAPPRSCLRSERNRPDSPKRSGNHNSPPRPRAERAPDTTGSPDWVCASPASTGRSFGSPTAPGTSGTAPACTSSHAGDPRFPALRPGSIP